MALNLVKAHQKPPIPLFLSLSLSLSSPPLCARHVSLSASLFFFLFPFPELPSLSLAYFGLIRTTTSGHRDDACASQARSEGLELNGEAQLLGGQNADVRRWLGGWRYSVFTVLKQWSMAIFYHETRNELVQLDFVFNLIRTLYFRWKWLESWHIFPCNWSFEFKFKPNRA